MRHIYSIKNRGWKTLGAGLLVVIFASISRPGVSQIIITPATNTVFLTNGNRITVLKGLPQFVANHASLAEAARHYETEDLPQSQIVDMFNWLTFKGDPRGTMWLAHLGFDGRCSVPKDPPKAQAKAKTVINEVIKLAEQGDAEAEFLLGAAYNDGLAVDKDLEKAQLWYTKAAAGGQLTAINNLGTLYMCGCGLHQDIAKAHELFSQATKQGSKHAAANLQKFEDNGHQDQLTTLRKNALAQALGMQLPNAIEFLNKNNLVSDPKGYTEADDRGQRTCLFKADGIILHIRSDGRVTCVEGHVKDSFGPGQFRGELPFDLTWGATAASVMQQFGVPDDCGSAQADLAFAVVYRMRNVNFALMFFYNGSDKLKIWRAFEVWPVDYNVPAPLPPPNAAASPETD